ncbi:MAG: hypothetical protein D6731_13595 [Planctomycetota bacterium]|nr:MAG: hypothetical protein D6731_13595 [Planctomycetota bacterium]
MKHFLARPRALFLLPALLVAACLGGAAASRADDGKGDADRFREHLELLNYTCTPQGDGVLLFQTEGANPNFLFAPQNGGYILRSYWSATEAGKAQRAAFLDLVNQLNAEAVASRYFLDGDGDLVAEAWFPGGYEKKSFGNFLSRFNADWTVCLGKHGPALQTFVE